MPVNPHMKKILDTKQAMQARMEKRSPEMIREASINLLSQQVVGPGFDKVQVKEFMIPIDKEPLPARLYTPQGTQTDNLILYYHGGGFMMGSIDTYDNFCRALAQETSNSVLSFSYHLAPENPFPTAWEEAYQAFIWASKNMKQLNKNKLIVAGDSAGGNLAAEVALRAKKEEGPPIFAQVLIYPWLDLSCSTPSIEMDRNECFATKDDLLWFSSQYYRGDNPKDWRVSPLWAQDLSHLPPAVIITAEYDSIHDDGKLYAQRLEKEGVKVAYRDFEGMIHGFIQMRGVTPDADEAILWIGKEIEKWG